MTREGLVPLLVVALGLVALAPVPAAAQQGDPNVEIVGVTPPSPGVTSPRAGPMGPRIGTTAPRVLGRPLGPRRASWASIAGNFAVGLAEGVVDMVKGLWDLVTDSQTRRRTWDGLKAVASDPTLIGTMVGQWWQDLKLAMETDPDRGARMLGKATFDVGSLAVGGVGAVRGISALTRMARGARVAGVVTTTGEVAHSARTAGAVATTTGEVAHGARTAGAVASTTEEVAQGAGAAGRVAGTGTRTVPALPGGTSTASDAGRALTRGSGTADDAARAAQALEPLGVEAGLAEVGRLRTALGVGRKRNIAVVDFGAGGRNGRVIGVSGDHPVAGTSPVPAQRQFATVSTGQNPRLFDAEVKALEDLATRLKPTDSGVVRIFSERPFCISCAGVVDQFRRRFPGIRVIAQHGPGT